MSIYLLPHHQNYAVNCTFLLACCQHHQERVQFHCFSTPNGSEFVLVSMLTRMFGFPCWLSPFMSTCRLSFFPDLFMLSDSTCQKLWGLKWHTHNVTVQVPVLIGPTSWAMTCMHYQCIEQDYLSIQVNTTMMHILDLTWQVHDTQVSVKWWHHPVKVHRSICIYIYWKWPEYCCNQCTSSNWPAPSNLSISAQHQLDWFH